MSPGSENTTRGEPIDLLKDMDEKFVAALDVGTTTLRCYVFDQKAQLRGSAVDQVNKFWHF